MTVVRLPVGVAGTSARRFFLLATGPSSTNVRLLAAAAERFRDVDLVTADELQVRVGPEDVVLARLDVRPTLDGIERGLLELQELERDPWPPTVLNRAGVLFVCHDKVATGIALRSAGIPHPRTACVDHASQLRNLEPPVVLKPRLGRGGADVFVCDTRRELQRCFRAIRDRSWYRRHGALVQTYLPGHGPELRVLVAAGAVVGTTVPPAAAALAVRAALTVHADLVQVDLIQDRRGRWVVLDLNCASEIASDDDADADRVCALALDRLAALAALPDARSAPRRASDRTQPA
ncbi:MAG: ATP-grasp domain-containing protein [Gaiellaceae bacterium]